MKKKEILKKDLPYLTAEVVIKNNAYLETIIETQIFILSKLTNTPQKDVAKKISTDIKENEKAIRNKLNKNIHNSNIMSIFN